MIQHWKICEFIKKDEMYIIHLSNIKEISEYNKLTQINENMNQHFQNKIRKYIEQFGVNVFKALSFPCIFCCFLVLLIHPVCCVL